MRIREDFVGIDAHAQLGRAAVEEEARLDARREQQHGKVGGQAAEILLAVVTEPGAERLSIGLVGRTQFVARRRPLLLAFPLRCLRALQRGIARRAVACTARTSRRPACASSCARRAPACAASSAARASFSSLSRSASLLTGVLSCGSCRSHAMRRAWAAAT